MDGVIHFEMPVNNVKRASKFYKELFGWNLVSVPEMSYTLVHTAKTDKDGMIQEKGKINGGLMERSDSAPNIVLVMNVKDIDASLKKAQALGATITMPKDLIPGVGHYARIKDTEGNILGLMQTVEG